MSGPQSFVSKRCITEPETVATIQYLFNDLPGGNQDIHNMAVKCRSMSGLYHSIEPIISVPAVIGFEQKKTLSATFATW